MERAQKALSHSDHPASRFEQVVISIFANREWYFATFDGVEYRVYWQPAQKDARPMALVERHDHAIYLVRSFAQRAPRFYPYLRD